MGVPESPEWITEVVAARAGDEGAQAKVLVRFTPLVRSTASRLIAAEQVDDVVQESLTVALASLPALRTPEAFPSWLRLIVRKQADRHRRGSGDLPLYDLDRPDGTQTDPAEVVERRDLAAVVRVALCSVSDQDRRLLQLRYLAGWTNDELAELLGVSNAAVRKRLHDARRRLRPHIEHLNPKEKTVTDYRTYLGTIHGTDIHIPPASPLAPAGAQATTTGIKVIDTMAPLRRGGTIEMVGPAGTGQMVLALELLYRLGRTDNDVACVAVGRTGAAIGSQPDLGHVVTEPGIPGPNAAILTDQDGSTRAAFEAGTRLAAGLAHTGLDVVLVIDEPSLRHLDRAVLVNAAGLAEKGAVTVVAVRALDRGADAPTPVGLDTTLVFSVEQFALGIFPAVDPTRSTSTLPASEASETARQRLIYAAELRAWFNQPLYLAQDYTGEQGNWVEPEAAEATLADLTR